MILHATSVAFGNGGVLVLGQSGSGKSSLALEMISLGAQLVADDRTRVTSDNGTLWASPVSETRGLIEARGVGILRCPSIGQARLALAIDLDQEEAERLPPRRTTRLLDRSLPLIRARNHASLGPVALLWLSHGRVE